MAWALLLFSEVRLIIIGLADAQDTFMTQASLFDETK